MYQRLDSLPPFTRTDRTRSGEPSASVGVGCAVTGWTISVIGTGAAIRSRTGYDSTFRIIGCGESFPIRSGNHAPEMNSGGTPPVPSTGFCPREDVIAITI